MQYVSIPRVAERVSRLGLGCSRVGSTLSECNGAKAIRLIHGALDQGVTLFDTADIYGQGDSERLLGQALAGRREQAVLITKAGQVFSAKQRAMALLKGPIRLAARHVPALRQRIASRRAGLLPTDFTPARIEASLTASLKRLRTDRVELFLLHGPTEATLQDAALLEALARMQQRGSFRAWGVSAEDPATALAAIRLDGMAVLQMPVHAAISPAWRDVLALAHASGRAVIAREILSSIPADPETGARDPNAVRDALAWAIAQPGATAALLGTTNESRLATAASSLP